MKKEMAISEFADTISPVPVEFTDEVEGGRYYKCPSPPHIKIQKSYDNLLKISVLLHEVGHAQCDKKIVHV